MSRNYILGIESSCDDTSASVILDGTVLSNIVSNQEVHKKYGGVVPELASRTHQKNIIPVVHQALAQANISQKNLSAIAFTQGPGLLGSLLVGSSFSKSLSMALNIPLIGVNHMQAHVMAHFINGNPNGKPDFPFLCLIVSGGHTQIVKYNSYFDFETIGETIDDAAGEAFDKIGKYLGLDYPAGPIIDKNSELGNPNKFKFSKPKVEALNYSFSGLKTSVLYFVKKEIKKDNLFVKNNLNDLCASVQQTIVSILLEKLIIASEKTGIKSIALAGGVSANSFLRDQLTITGEKQNWKVYIPKFEYTTDNAAMIAMVGLLKFKEKKISDITTTTQARLKSF